MCCGPAGRPRSASPATAMSSRSHGTVWRLGRRTFPRCIASASAIESFNKEDAFIKIIPTAELGITKVLFHTLQFGNDGYVFDYVNNGGQEILYLFERYSVDAVLAGRHTLTFLYQPLTLETQTRVPAGLTGGIKIDDTVFPAGSALDLKYGFDFFRFSYLFSFLNTERFMLGAGLSLQLRHPSGPRCVMHWGAPW